ncbi:DUF427 domain-containing protein [Mesorhizobium xinjiangense]|uniref:DUF427 domain-containing protein n=1 Tax=Mesorhizobium xinjiangense TaxID=2678685 RepID=UPI0012EEE125|nr:DUF427 domain-containing protein [Mesorhizobium xinjiangense]
MTATANPSPGYARNPGKVITLEPVTGTVTVRAGGTVIARSTRAMKLSEPPYPPVLYIPFDDVLFEHLERTAHSTHCPYKGDASYWTVLAIGETGENAMWAYEAPFDEMLAIKDHAAFYPDRVTVETVPG